MIQIKTYSLRTIQRKYGLSKRNATNLLNLRLGTVANKLVASIKEEISSGGEDEWGFVHTGILMNSVKPVRANANTINIEQIERGGYILGGTKGNSTAKPNDALVEWAEEKLGLDTHDAYGVALHILRQGILSPESRAHYPEGARGYDYAEYVVDVKEKDYIEQQGDTVGKMIVQMLEA